MSRDLVGELRAVAGPEYQTLITDLFEKIMLYDVRVDAATAKPAGDGYEVTLDVTAQQFEADGRGNETDVPLSTWFNVVIFPDSPLDRMEQEPLYEARHLMHSGTQRVVNWHSPSLNSPGQPRSSGTRADMASTQSWLAASWTWRRRRESIPSSRSVW